jgi:phytoene dehydrogenase-like protein
MEKSIIIIGTGMGGLASGIYGRLNGYRTTMFEQHTLPGGQCASWKRKGYTFDVCIHHLFGCNSTSKIYQLWEELGAMPREMARTEECASVASPDGKLFKDYYDPGKLEAHLKELSPADEKVIDVYVKAITKFARTDFSGEAMMGSRAGLAKMVPSLIPLVKWFKPNMGQFAQKFTDPFLRRAFALLEYSWPDVPFFLHLIKHGYGYNGAIAWPIGASREFAGSMEKRYRDLGGEVQYKSGVKEILTEKGSATGVKLADGSEYKADIVISNADGRKTIMELLGGRFIDAKVRSYCQEPDDVSPMTLQVFLGVNRDLSGEPSALVQLLDEPIEVAGQSEDSLETQIYGFDPTMAPAGKGVVKVDLSTSYSYWKNLYADRSRYDEEKQRVADTIIDALDRTRFPGIKGQVEMVDVPTLMTWERYVGGTHGWLSFPSRKIGAMDMLFNKGYATLPGLSNCYLVGSWATGIGSLFNNALSGRKAIAAICGGEGKTFRSA